MWPFRRGAIDGGQSQSAADRRCELVATVELADFFAAHAVWCVSEGDTLVPLLGIEKNGERALHRILDEELAVAVNIGRDRLARNPDGADRAVLVTDGYITLAEGKVDAVLIEARNYSRTPGSLTVAIPYRHAEREGGFAVHRPKFLAMDNSTACSPEEVGQALFAGVAKHDEGNAIWTTKLDESL